MIDMPKGPPPLPPRRPLTVARVPVLISREDLAALQPLLARFESFSKHIDVDTEALIWRLRAAIGVANRG